MAFNEITTRIVRYFEDPKESKALAEIKRISNLAKNKSSKNLIYIDQNSDKYDSNTQKNTSLNQYISIENNENNNFQRRKHAFATQKYEQSISKEIKRKANLKNWNEVLNNNDEGDDNNVEKKNKNKNVKKNVKFTLNNKKKEENANDNQIKDNTYKPIIAKETNLHKNKTRKGSSDNKEIITQRIVRYLDDPKNSKALAEVKRISNQAKKNKTSKNLIYINPDDLSFQKEEIKENQEKPFKSSYKRRKFQFATTVYQPRKNNMTLIDELNEYKNIKIKKNEDEYSNKLGSEDDESEDSIFDLDKNNKNKETKENNTNIIENKDNADKGRQMIMEKYGNNVPKRDRNKYSSNTFNVNESHSYNNRKKEKDFNLKMPNNVDITEEYKKNNNLIVENVNNKEKIIKNEYHNKNPEKKRMKTYKTEYFWDKMINRLVERRIYEDEKEPSNKPNNKYNNNTFNPFNKYKNGFDTKENENNITKEKIELNEVKQPNKKEENNIIYSRKNKYMPHLYTTNTLKINNKYVLNNDKENDDNNEIEKPSYRIYQKRQIKKDDEKEKNILKKIPTHNSNIHSGKIKIKKNEEIKFKKIDQPYSHDINNTKDKKIRFNMLLERKNIFKEDEELFNKNDNNNNIYSKYMKTKKTTITYNRANDSELIEDLQKIERYSINTYLKNDLLEIYDNINDEFKDFKKGVFNTNLNDFETKMGDFDKNKNENIKRKNKFDVNDLCKGKPVTIDDIFRKYEKRAIIIEKEIYNN